MAEEAQAAAPATFELLGKQYESLDPQVRPDGEYDVIVLGSNIQLVLLAYAFCKEGKKVTLLDKNEGYYGGEGASLDLKKFLAQKVPDMTKDLIAKDKELVQKREAFDTDNATLEDRKAFYAASRKEQQAQDQAWREMHQKMGLKGDANHYAIDQMIKFVMPSGRLYELMDTMTGGKLCSAYQNFRRVEGSYVFKGKGVGSGFFGGGKKNYLFKVPGTAGEAGTTPLVGMTQKWKLKNFLLMVKEKDLATVPASKTAAQVYSECGMDENTQGFVGHACALFDSDGYLNKPGSGRDLIKRCKLYGDSLMRIGGSPYMYPDYGIGGIPESISRMAGVFKCVFQIQNEACPYVKDTTVVFDESGKAVGVTCGSKAGKAPIIIGEPKYFKKEQTRLTGKVARAHCFLDHPIEGTDNKTSVQIIIPQKEVAIKGYKARSHDIYISMASKVNAVCPNGMYLAIVSTAVENDADPRIDLQPGIDLLGNIVARFDSVSDIYEPVADGKADGCYISRSWSGASHFEDIIADFDDIYQRVMGKPYVIEPMAESK